jgi:hypothetical protein
MPTHFRSTLIWLSPIAAVLLIGMVSTPACGQEAFAAREVSLPSAPIPHYSPMTGQQRWNDYVRQNFAQPGVFFQTFFSALGDETGNRPSQWGGGAAKFPEHAASEFARFTIAGTVHSTVAAALQEDTRYYPCVCRDVLARTAHAMSRTVLTYDRNGKRTLDVGGLAGIYSGPMIMTTWYPKNYTALGYGVRQGNVAAAITTGIYLIREFSPELTYPFRRFRK